MERPERTSLVAGILSLAAGAALVVAPFLRWVSATIDRVGPGGIRRPGFAPGFARPGVPVARSLSVQGIGLPVGKLALVAGIVLIGTGFVLWLSASVASRTAMGIVGLVAATAAATLVLSRMAGFLDGGVLGRFQGVASRSLGAGTAVALLGALAGVAGCIVALAGPPRARRQAPPTGRSDVPAEPAPTPPEPEGAGAAEPEALSATRAPAGR
jgi:hypothetical protein